MGQVMVPHPPFLLTTDHVANWLWLSARLYDAVMPQMLQKPIKKQSAIAPLAQRRVRVFYFQLVLGLGIRGSEIPWSPYRALARPWPHPPPGAPGASENRLFSAPGPLKFKIFYPQTSRNQYFNEFSLIFDDFWWFQLTRLLLWLLKIDIFSLRTSKIQYFLSPDL